MWWFVLGANLGSPHTIFAKRSLMPTGVGGEAEKVGDDVEYVGEGVSGGELKAGIEGRRYCVLDGKGLMPHWVMGKGIVEGSGC